MPKNNVLCIYWNNGVRILTIFKKSLLWSKSMCFYLLECDDSPITKFLLQSCIVFKIKDDSFSYQITYATLYI